MDDIKFVISELNKSQFNKSLNVVSYDSMKSPQRLEVLLAVFKEIDPKV